MMPYVDMVWVNFASGKGLVPGGTKPLPEPMLTYHRWGSVALTWDQLHGKCSTYQWNEFEKYTC